MTRKRYGREISVGLFMVAALSVTALGILAIGRESRLFSPKVEYRTSFTNITGLTVGAPVRLSGVQVGTVRTINFSDDLDRQEIIVVMSVDTAFRSRIRTDSRALLRPLSYLSIEKYIEVTTGGPASAVVEPGGMIPPDLTELERFTVVGQDIAANLQEITDSLKVLLYAVSEGEGLISDLFFDKGFGRETRESLRDMTASGQRIMSRLEDPEGLLGRLLFDAEYANRQAQAIEDLTGRFNRILERFEAGEGALGDLLSEEGESKAAIRDFRNVIDDLGTTTDSLSEQRGLLGKLLHDEEFARNFIDRMERIATNLDSITAKIDSGAGSLGRFVNDPDVYDGLEDVVAGIRESKLLRALIKKYGKKGAQERIDQALEELDRMESEQRDGDGGDEDGGEGE